MKQEKLPAEGVSIQDLTEEAAGILTGHMDSVNRRVLEEVTRSRQLDGRKGQVRAGEISAAIQRISVLDARTHYLGLFRRVNKDRPPILLLAVAGVSLAMANFWLPPEGGKLGVWNVLPMTFGLILSLLGIFRATVYLISARRERAGRHAEMFLRKMGALEIDARNYVAREEGLDTAEGPLSAIFVVLVADGVWSSDDINDFRLLLRLRNAIVHEQKISLSVEQLGVALEQIERMRDLIPRRPRRFLPKQSESSANHSER
ncbi:hypothetical protein [Micromonospora trifolii]|uniref:hypothetical protein n=1 Tax=Micromonospora trifolii TaxID=2911208 RepID=UPI003CF7A477